VSGCGSAPTSRRKLLFAVEILDEIIQKHCTHETKQKNTDVEVISAFLVFASFLCRSSLARESACILSALNSEFKTSRRSSKDLVLAVL
jgi:hypothetical protein